MAVTFNATASTPLPGTPPRPVMGRVSEPPDAIGRPLLAGPGVRVSRSRAGVIGTNNPVGLSGALDPSCSP